MFAQNVFVDRRSSFEFNYSTNTYQNHKMKLEEVEKICPFCGEVFSQSIIHEHISSNHLGLDFWNDSGSQPCPTPKIKSESTRSTPKRAIGKLSNCQLDKNAQKSVTLTLNFNFHRKSKRRKVLPM